MTLTRHAISASGAASTMRLFAHTFAPLYFVTLDTHTIKLLYRLFPLYDIRQTQTNSHTHTRIQKRHKSTRVDGDLFALPYFRVTLRRPAEFYCTLVHRLGGGGIRHGGRAHDDSPFTGP